jgi:hypothetical protein
MDNYLLEQKINLHRFCKVLGLQYKEDPLMWIIIHNLLYGDNVKPYGIDDEITISITNLLNELFVENLRRLIKYSKYSNDPFLGYNKTEYQMIYSGYWSSPELELNLARLYERDLDIKGYLRRRLNEN